MNRNSVGSKAEFNPHGHSSDGEASHTTEVEEWPGPHDRLSLW